MASASIFLPSCERRRGGGKSIGRSLLHAKAIRHWVCVSSRPKNLRRPQKLLASKAHREAQRERHQISQGTLVAAEWVILVTSLSPNDFSTADVLALYRLRWRIELGFKRLKSLIGLKGPPSADERSAKPYLLAHLLFILLLEPLIDELEDSPLGP